MIEIVLIVVVVVVALALLAGGSQLIESGDTGVGGLMVLGSMLLIPLLALYLNAVNPS